MMNPKNNPFWLSVLALTVVWLRAFILLASPATTYQATTTASNHGRVLLFVAYNDVWWSEYKVTYEALQALGYTVDVVSSGTGEAYTYGGPVDGSLQTDWGQFAGLFATNFGVAWNDDWTAADTILLDGRIQDIADLSQYNALVIPGGRGAIAYRYDGSYAALSPQDAPGTHVTTAVEVQSAAEKLNDLINEALATGKPVLGQCHAAPLVAFARRDGTTGSGHDGLGISVLAGQHATGYHLEDGTTAADYATLGITYLANEKVVLDGPEAPHYSGNGRDMLLTSRDWFAETVAYATKTLDNMLTSYPSPAERTAAVSVLVFGGDEPAHYLPQEPARYTDLVTLLNDPMDGLNIAAVGTNNPADMTLANLQNYDVLLYFRHDTIPQAGQEAIEAYVAGGGGLVGIHHAIYNHLGQKQTLIDLFGGELPQQAQLNNELWLVYFGEQNHLLNVNLGHFVSSYGATLLPGDPSGTADYTSPLGLPNPNLDGDGTRGYYHFTIPANDELYTGNRFNDGVVFGDGHNQINRLFANDRFVGGSPNPNNGQYDAWGWTKLYNTGGNTTGRIVYLQPGETADRSLAQPAYAQVIKNGVIWASLGGEEVVITPTPTASPTATYTPTPVFSATLSVVPSQTEVLVGETVDVVVSLQVNPACQYLVLELQLAQTSSDGATLAYTMPTTDTVGAPVTNPFTYTLTALTTGTVSFNAQTYGELNCGSGWVWTYVNGSSTAVHIVDETIVPTNHLYLPLVRRDE
ncbi:MAG: ThuA domain-containing protein [Chloroflexi bacterium]|nr:ThuA domain-containing protein [Chloroflexota bacterium]